MTDLKQKAKVGDVMISKNVVFIITEIQKNEAKVQAYFRDSEMRQTMSARDRGVRLHNGKYVYEDWATLRFATKAEIAKYRLLAEWQND